MVNGNSVEFPPADGPYSGDYVYITEPGRYTLERPVSHSYPVGIIIAASSVILDGQGYQVEPADPMEKTSVGIWIRLTDDAGNPVTGVNIRNVSINNEDCGVYVEGTDTSMFVWGSDGSGDPEVARAVSSPRSLTLSEMTLSRCGDGIVLMNHPDVLISEISVENGSDSGIVVDKSTARIVQCRISNTGGDGIRVSGGSGSEISSSTITSSGNVGLNLDTVSDIRIFNNILDNTVNIKAGSPSPGIVLQTAREDGENIIGGRILGGNYWVSAESESISDIDRDGIGDSPYDPGIGISDLLPLVRPDENKPEIVPHFTPALTPEVAPVSTPVVIQTPQSFISGTHAAIVSDTIPAEMNHGRVYPVTLQLYNDGSDDWITQHKIGIMALGDSAGYGLEWMPAMVVGTVQPGKMLNVEFSIKAPSVPGIYTLKYQAAREGSGVEVLYGRPYTKTVTVR